jgi:DNA-binding XRE family transcriptional regulator
MLSDPNRTVEEWEQQLGAQIRAARVAARLDQATLAELANVSITALSGLERGKGSSLRTFVATVRAPRPYGLAPVPIPAHHHLTPWYQRGG